MSTNYIFQGSVSEIDPELSQLLQREDDRQDSTIILIASESASPEAVREAMSSNFGNIYAEGYPREESRRQSQAEILDMDRELAHYRRYSDPRYYKGVEYADMLEALTRRRAAELFAANGVKPDQLYVNVQPLSGAPANSAVYTALLQPGDTIMGLNLNDGGHLSHGSRVNRSGKIYNSAPYFVDPQSEVLDYDAIEKQALEIRPQIIVAGYSAYPKIVNWQRFRDIADKCGAYFMADIAHISGLVASGVHPSPIGIADIVTTTTHKSLCGPRGAMIMTHKADLARKLDRAVFPGEQGGPHLNTMAALAVALKLAKTEQFHELQERIVHNAQRLGAKLEEHGLRLVGGQSENHLLLVDTKSVQANGVNLSGDMAARILDVAGIVLNRNTIPGDKGALNPTGLRLGTVWISQLGFGDAEVDLLAEAIATTLNGCTPYTYLALGGKEQPRAKVDYAALQRARDIVRQLRGRAKPAANSRLVEVRGAAAQNLLNHALASDVLALQDDESQATHIDAPGLKAEAVLYRHTADLYHLIFSDKKEAQETAVWLSALSDGYVMFADVYAKLSGPVAIRTLEPENLLEKGASAIMGGIMDLAKALNDKPDPEAIAATKPYFIGCETYSSGEALPAFTWEEPADPPMKRTKLYDTHVAMGGRMIPFGGYEMPVWYSSVSEEHQAVRETAGLFDATHMGVFDASGPHVVEFLNTVTTNDVSALAVGQSHYTYFLLPDGSVVDDLMIYRLAEKRFMIVVNASNNDKDWAWLNAVNEGKVRIDAARPFARIQHPVTLRDLRDPAHGAECRVDMPLQGPKSRDILLSLIDDPALARRLKTLPWAGVTSGQVGGHDVVISRTGYTGERIAFEIFVHPDESPELWQQLVAAGESMGIKPCGLAARDSTRTEGGLPLYGHELAGDLGLNPADAGFGSYVKLWKPFFVGRSAFLAYEAKRDRVVTRFRMNEKGVRRPEGGDPVLDKRGKVIGKVTSCAIDSDGYLLGQAVLPEAMSGADTAVFIYQLGGGQRPIRVPDNVQTGARLPMPDAATVLTRFPSRKK
ncbi:MAG: glycine cleavage system aminomethyltransferase GcvT [Chloroflexi bacterium]|nr:glycine cleavage system aminomethyltransferase GcvT [Chloroflexota bacterium]